jgi:uncharacterized membrane protein YecN with MAPEG domain
VAEAYSDFQARCKSAPFMLCVLHPQSRGSLLMLPITLTMAAAAAFVHVWLAARCSMVRQRENILVGYGGNAVMTARMRAHANFAENTPLFLILLGLNELAGSSGRWLWWIGIAFILARVAHALGMDRRTANMLRIFGMTVSMLVLVILAISAIRLAYEAGQPVVIG